VIAFDLSLDKKKILADIAISTDTAIRQAKIFKTSPLYETYLYVVHGVLHIIGYRDATFKQRKLMDEKAHYILEKLQRD